MEESHEGQRASQGSAFDGADYDPFVLMRGCRYGQNGDLFGSIRGGVSGMDKSYPSKAKRTVFTVLSFGI